MKEHYQTAFDRAILLEQLGFDFVMTTEHHFMVSQWNPSPLLLLAGIARQTSVINPGTNVLLTPLYHPGEPFGSRSSHDPGCRQPHCDQTTRS